VPTSRRAQQRRWQTIVASNFAPPDFAGSTAGVVAAFACTLDIVPHMAAAIPDWLCC
jgi:hypothetical protein